MKCKQAKELMGGYLYGDLAPDEMREVRLHTQDCTACRDDLAERGGVVSALSDVAPQLSDEDRQEVTWSVNGAISAQARERRTFGIRLAPAVGLATVLLVGFAVGALVSSRVGKQTPARAVKQPARPSAIIIKTPPSRPAEETAVKPQEEEPVPAVRRTHPIRLIPTIANISSRAQETPKHAPNTLPDAPLQLVPTPETDDSAAASGSLDKLPRPVDLEEAHSAEPIPDN